MVATAVLTGPAMVFTFLVLCVMLMTHSFYFTFVMDTTYLATDEISFPDTIHMCLLSKMTAWLSRVQSSTGIRLSSVSGKITYSN